MTRHFRTILALAGAAALAACTDPEFSALGAGRVNSAGPVQILTAQNEVFTAGRLADMVDAAAQPGSARVVANTATWSQDDAAAAARLDAALANFSRAPYAAGVERALEQNRLRDARNMIQDQLIAASNNRCNVYKAHLRRLSSNTGFVLGGLSTITGAVGAVVTGTASQALAGAASAFSGLNAEFQKDFFNGLVTAVIIPGIDRQRADIRNDIVRRSCAGVTDYPLALAIAEAIRYHGACSADVGIAASGQAIARTSPDSLSSVLIAAQQIQRISGALTTPTNAQARGLKATAAQDTARVTVLKARLDAANLTLQSARADPKFAGDVARLEQTANALTKAYNDAIIRAAGSSAVATNLGTERAEGVTPQPGAAPSIWSDPTPARPLVGENTVVVDCKPLDGNGK